MKRIRAWSDAFAAGAVVWAAALPAAAIGRVHAPPESLVRFASGLVYVAGAVVCHQRPERSFVLGGQPLPVCARCLGIYAAAAISAAILLLPADAARRLLLVRSFAGSRFLLYIAIAAVMPTAATLVWEWTSGMMPSNSIRALAGVPIGVFVSWVVLRSVQLTAHSG